MKDKVILITGANSGIGRATAERLAEMGTTVVMSARHEKRGEKARAQIVRRTGNDRVDLLIADLSTRDGIRSLADQFRAKYDRLDVLINNAGLMTNKRRETPEGFELQFFVNHLAYFMLTQLLIDMLRDSAPARIVNVASTAHSRGHLNFDDLQGKENYAGWQMYGNTKLANIVFTYELARRLENSGVTANCVHPGVVGTNLMRQYNFFLNLIWGALRVFFKKPEEGAETPAYLATSPEVADVRGKYFRYCRPFGTTEESNDRDVQRRLWEASIEMTGLDNIPA